MYKYFIFYLFKFYYPLASLPGKSSTTTFNSLLTYLTQLTQLTQLKTMSEFTRKLKEPFEDQLSQQHLQLDLANAELDEIKEVINHWPARKKRIYTGILKPMQKWSADLKKMAKPLDMRKYKREKKRLLRFKNITWSHWRGFTLSLKLAFLWILNMIRILMILSFFIGIILLAVFLVIKGFEFIGSLFK